jgi:CBS domain-containing protein
MTSTRTIPSTPLDTVTVEQVMHVGFIGCPLETPLVNVARLRAEHGVHAIVGFGDVTEDDTQLWGLVSDIDVVAALAAGGSAMTAGEIAASEVVTIGAHDPVRRAVELMNDHQIAHLLVVDPGSDRPVGVVSTLDIAALVARFDSTDRAS